MKKLIFVLSATTLLASCSFEQKPAPYEAKNSEFYGRGHAPSGYASNDYIAPSKKRSDSRFSVEGSSTSPLASAKNEDDYNRMIDQQNSQSSGQIVARPLASNTSPSLSGTTESYSHEQDRVYGNTVRSRSLEPIAIDGNEQVVKVGEKPSLQQQSLHATAPEAIKPRISEPRVETAYDLQRNNLANQPSRPIDAPVEETVPPVGEAKPGYLNLSKINQQAPNQEAADKLARIKPQDKPEFKEEEVAVAQVEKTTVEETPEPIVAKVQRVETVSEPSAGVIEKSTPAIMNKQIAADEEREESITLPPEKPAVKTVEKAELKEEVPPVASTPVVTKSVTATNVTVAKQEEEPEEKKVTDIKPQPAKNAPQFIKPVDGVVVSEFGGNKSDGSFNDGISIQAPEGTPVKAANSGTVVYSGNQLQGYGNLIIIRHPDGYLTAYSHLKELELKKGESISQGEVVGHVGKTGNVESPQLHFGIRKGREPVDPKDYL